MQKLILLLSSVHVIENIVDANTVTYDDMQLLPDGDERVLIEILL